MKQPTRLHVSQTEAERVLRSCWRSNTGSDLRVWNARLWSCQLYGWFRRGRGPMGSEFLFGAHREHTQFPCRAETGTKRFIAGESIPGELWQKGLKMKEHNKGLLFPELLEKTLEEDMVSSHFLLFHIHIIGSTLKIPPPPSLHPAPTMCVGRGSSVVPFAPQPTYYHSTEHKQPPTLSRQQLNWKAVALLPSPRALGRTLSTWQLLLLPLTNDL